MQAANFAQKSSVAATRPHSEPGPTTRSHGITGRKRLLDFGDRGSPHKSSKKSHALPSSSPLSAVEELLVQVRPTRTVSIISNSSSSSSEILGTPSVSSDTFPPLLSLEKEDFLLRSSRPITFADSLIDLPDRLSVMVQLDLTAYRCPDYLCKTKEKIKSTRTHSPTSLNGFHVEESRGQRGEVFSKWRQKMAKWSYQIVDHFGYEREVVALSMSFLDRYLSSCSTEIVVSARAFQLLAISTLFLACKLHSNDNGNYSRPQQRLIGASTLAKLSRGNFVAGKVEATEMLILSHLGWRVHPPTALDFVKHLCLLLPQDACTPQERVQLAEKSNFLVELSVMHGAFVGYKRSTIALAAIDVSFNLSDKWRQMLAHSAYSDTGLKPNIEEITECTDKLIKISTANEK